MSIITTADLTHLRNAGILVHEVKGWSTRGHAPGGPAEGIIIHHTAGPKTGNMPSLRTLVEGRPDLKGPLCNFGLARDGSLYVVAAGLAYHAGAVKFSWAENRTTIGVEVESDGKQKLTDAQQKTLVVLCGVLHRTRGIRIGNIQGHREVCFPKGRKIDPRPYSMSALRKATTAYVTPRKAVKGVPVTSQVKALQEAVGLPPAQRDGVWGPVTDARVAAYKADWIAGKLSRRKAARVRKALGFGTIAYSYTKQIRNQLARLRAVSLKGQKT